MDFNDANCNSGSGDIENYQDPNQVLSLKPNFGIGSDSLFPFFIQYTAPLSVFLFWETMSLNTICLLSKILGNVKEKPKNVKCMRNKNKRLFDVILHFTNGV